MKPYRKTRWTSLLALMVISSSAFAAYPVVRPSRDNPAPDSGRYVIYPDRDQQVVWGLGFEIQSDSIGSGNDGLPEERTSVPHDLTPEERERFYDEMLTGFRYCRLAGGLYWRGTDPSGRILQPRWPEQLEEIREMCEAAGVEGLSFEYWSPAPFWKANGQYTKQGQDASLNRLRCFGPDFDKDPVYRGDVDRFLKDFAAAVVQDIRTLEEAGLPVLKWGLQNEPFANTNYSSCKYTVEEYVRTFPTVARAVREYDPSISIIADTAWGKPSYIAPVMRTKDADLVDHLVVHAIGDDSKRVPNNFKQTRALIKQELPLYQNEYEYLQGPASRDRCHNTVQNIMNWFQLAESPTWYWIHALKPYKNIEASGYSLGFWMPANAEPYDPDEIAGPSYTSTTPRTSDQYTLGALPEDFVGLTYVSVNRGDGQKPGRGFKFRIDKRCRVFLAVHQRGDWTPPAGWEPTDMKIAWGDTGDKVYSRVFEAGLVEIPAHDGRMNNGWYGIPHLALVQDISGETVVVNVELAEKVPGGQVGVVQGSETENLAKILKPGHWTWNKYNWHSVVGFLRHMPWDSTVVKLKEENLDHDMRILAYKRPDGKLVICVSNRSWKDYTFKIKTGLDAPVFKGYRYTPDETGEDFMGGAGWRGAGLFDQSQGARSGVGILGRAVNTARPLRPDVGSVPRIGGFESAGPREG